MVRYWEHSANYGAAFATWQWERANEKLKKAQEAWAKASAEGAGGAGVAESREALKLALAEEARALRQMMEKGDE